MAAGRGKRWGLIALRVLLVLIAGGILGFRVAVGVLKGKVVEALGPDSEITGIRVGWASLDVEGCGSSGREVGRRAIRCGHVSPSCPACAACARDNFSEAADARTLSVLEDQLRTAIDAVGGALPPRRRVLGFAAGLRVHPLVDDTAARRAMANRRLRPSMIQVVARLAPSGFGCHVALHSVSTPDHGSRREQCASASRWPSRTAAQKRARALRWRPSPSSRRRRGITTPNRSRTRPSRCHSRRKERLNVSRSCIDILAGRAAWIAVHQACAPRP